MQGSGWMSRHVVVIDDNHRFAVHVWQYLAGSPAFGIGDLAREDVEGLFLLDPAGERRPRAAPTPSFRDRVWWIDAKWPQGRIVNSLESILDRVGEEACSVLLDVRGPRGPDADYDLDDLIERLSKKDFRRDSEAKRRLILVSAYSKASHPFRRGLLRVHEKAPDTLRSLWEAPETAPSSLGAQHILVTGAGFELPGEIIGNALGIPPTETLVRKALEAVKGLAKRDDWEPVKEYTLRKKKVPTRFAFPAYWDRMQGPGFLPSEHDPQGGSTPFVNPLPLKKAAEEGDLDAYWDELLHLELLDRMVEEYERSLHRAQIKHLASRWELDLREAFRRVLLAYDWGYLNQSVDAAALPWGAWLTTNYTRFADRAIALEAKKSAGRPWRVISTSNEAAHLLREILHGPESGEKASRDRYLFKLHGDIAHLTTMAIAGHDKEIFTPLSMPIDSLHRIYGVAEQCLEWILRRDKRHVVWHVVGHGLQDRQLTEILRRVSGREPERHRFVVVDPLASAAATVRSRLKAALGGEPEIKTLPFTAEEYLACLRWQPELMAEDPVSLDEWAEALPVAEAECQRQG